MPIYLVVEFVSAFRHTDTQREETQVRIERGGYQGLDGLISGAKADGGIAEVVIYFCMSKLVLVERQACSQILSHIVIIQLQLSHCQVSRDL